MKLLTYITYSKKYFDNIFQDLIFQSNAINIIDLFCLDEDDSTVDITGATVTLMIKINPTDEDTDAVINKIINPADLTNPLNGNTLIEILSTECESIVGNFVYELRIALIATGNQYILRQGNLTFIRSIYGL